MERSKRIFTFITFLICCLCLTLLVGSLATQNWLTAKPIRFNLLNSTSSLKSDPTKFRGEIHLGLFQCTKILNYGFGDRKKEIWIKDELIKNPNLMPFSLWLFTIISVAIAILFGVVSSIFAIINTVMTPIEVITGIHGLFLWNGIGALFCTSACISWLIQYRNKLRKNILSQDELNDGWSSHNLAWLGYSYFLVLITLGLFLFNILLIFILTKKPWSRNKNLRSLQNKNPEGVIMLY